MGRLLRTLLVIVFFSGIAAAQCGQLVVNPTTGNLDCIGSSTRPVASSSLTDFSVVLTSPTVLTIGSTCSATSPCLARFGSLICSVSNSATATISAGSAISYIYLDSSCNIDVAQNSNTVTCSGCTANSNTGFPSGNSGIPLWQWAATSGAWQTSGGVNQRGWLSTNPVLQGAGIALTQGASGTTIALNSLALQGASSGGGSASSATYTTANPYYFPIVGGTLAPSTTTSSSVPVVSVATGAAGVISAFGVTLGTAPSTATVTFTFFDGSTAEPVTCSITGAAKTCFDTTHNFAFAQGDFLSVQMTITTASITSTVAMVWGTGQVGPAGATGPTGAQGANGTTGPAGLTGPTGFSAVAYTLCPSGCSATIPSSGSIILASSHGQGINAFAYATNSGGSQMFPPNFSVSANSSGDLTITYVTTPSRIAIFGGTAAASQIPGLATIMTCDPTVYSTLNACLAVANAFATTNESGSGLAVRVLVSQGSWTLNPIVSSLTLTAAANASGGNTVYTGTITGGGTNPFVGLTFLVSGFDNSVNNGLFIAVSSTGTSLTLANPSGVSDTHAATTMSPFVIGNGVQIIGVLPRIEVTTGPPDEDVVLNGGTVINCQGTYGCFAGSKARGIQLSGLAFTNYTGVAVWYGGNTLQGCAFCNFSDLYAVGSSTVNGTYGAWTFYNSQHIQLDRLFAYNVNQGWNLTAQTNDGTDYGNFTINDAFTATYPKSVANGNNSIPGALFQILTPASGGTIGRLNNITLNRWQINSYNGDSTGTNMAMNGLSSARQLIGINITGADLEGVNLYGLQISYMSLSYVNLTTTVGNTYDIQTQVGTIQNVFSCSSNCVLAPGPGSYTWNSFYGQIYALPTYNSGGIVGAFTDYSTASAVCGQCSWLDQFGNAGPPITANAFINQGTSTFTASGCSNSTLVGGGSAGSFHSGTTGTCTVTVTMKTDFGAGITAPNGWTCWANNLTTNADTIKQTASTATTATLSGTTVSGDVINFGCMGY